MILTDQDHHFEIFEGDSPCGECVLYMLDKVSRRKLFPEFYFRETACRGLACFAVMFEFSHGENNPVELGNVYRKVLETGCFKTLAVKQVDDTANYFGKFISEDPPPLEHGAFPGVGSLLQKLRQLKRDRELPEPIYIQPKEKPKLKTVYRTRDIYADWKP